ncbi:MAG: DJ-1/PfpI family protein [Gammaproteobacteria bacterium]|nr:DJ-1/PfpI family protein [Gammaproteobacteria bacterium]
MPRVLIPLAQGCEELEAVTLIDLLRRARIEVVTAGLAPGPVTGSRGTVLLPDSDLDAVLEQAFDMVVLPGGQPGATHLENDARILALLKSMAAAGKYTAAICAAPKVLAVAGLLDGRHATCYPGSLDAEQFPKIHLDRGAVVRDGRVLTSRGPGTAMDFALELIAVLAGEEQRDAVEKALMRPAEQAPDQLPEWG